MATAELKVEPAAISERGGKSQATGQLRAWLMPLASLRLTVVLLVLAIFLVFAGTLSQVNNDVWHVVNNTHFRVWVAKIDFQSFAELVRMFTKTDGPPISGWLPFPGGKTLGVLMALNLLAAHGLRFTVQAKGNRLVWGIVLTLLGMLATLLVVTSGFDSAVESQLSPEFINTLWQILRGGLAVAALGGAFVLAKQPKRDAAWWLWAALDVLALGVAAWLLWRAETRLGDSGMRILWQLIKAQAAATVLLAGCVLLFRKRAGVVLLHGGIALLMLGELVTDLTVEEAQMSIAEGATTNYAQDIRSVELAITDRSDAKQDRVVVIPQSILAAAAKSGEKLSHPDAAYDVKVREFFVNADIEPLAKDAPNLATAEVGLTERAVERAPVSGVSQEQNVNLPAAYVELFDKKSGDSVAVLMTSALLRSPQPVSKESSVDIALRFKRLYKDYSVTLRDFKFDRYIGTNTPKNYSSDVTITDASQDVERDFRIFMNNPLRYRGDTLYQSGFDETTERGTVLQVVSNESWMIPYVACMVVATGMLAHFGLTLGRFLQRRQDETLRAAPAVQHARQPIVWSSPAVWLPIVMALVWGGYLLGKARPVNDAAGGMRINQFAALPVADGGRIKPLDSLARTTLQYLSGKQEVVTSTTKSGKLSAERWLLDVIAGAPGSRDYRVFRITDLDLLSALGLEPRPGKFRYSFQEIVANEEKLGKQVQPVLMKDEKTWTPYERQVATLWDKLTRHVNLEQSFSDPQIDADPEKIQASLQLVAANIERLTRGAPLAIPGAKLNEPWSTFYEANFRSLLGQAQGQPPNPAVASLSAALDAYREGDAAGVNVALAKYQAELEKHEAKLRAASPEELAGLAASERPDLGRLKFEQWFNHFSPFYYCAVTYLVAFLLCVASWLGWSKPLGRSALAVVLVTFAVHTFALIARIYISGRPPVTNLYSSAVFIGWAVVLFGIVLEAIYKMGVGTIVASVVGFLTLVVGHMLSLDGDTFTVLQAVLDTQFWLATHVVCVTLGYAATYLAGAIAILGLVGGELAGKLSLDQRRQISRMVYGTICFGIFFSFVGTVLGGLWADDSWGRFWGWDPKENGALIIVLWNAVVLHARWGKLVGDTGLAMLAVVGNIVTTWSWFGVNELGVGLHAYGANESNTATWLLVFVLSQLAVLAAVGFVARDRSPVRTQQA